MYINNFLSANPKASYICKLNKPIEKPQLSSKKQKTPKMTKKPIKSKGKRRKKLYATSNSLLF